MVYMICFTLKEKSICLVFVLLILWDKLLSTSTISQTYRKMGLHTQMFWFVLLNAYSNQTWVICMKIWLWLDTEDAILFNKQVITGVNIRQWLEYQK